MGQGESTTVVGYIRVSSPSQDYAYQRHAIEAAARSRGEKVGEWYGDVASGSRMDRPALGRLWAALDAGGVRRVWVWRLDRLTRSGIADMFDAVARVRSSGAELSSVADQLALDGGPAGELMLAVFAWCAQQERNKIRENQEAARARLAREGRRWGRPRTPDDRIDEVLVLKSQGRSVREIAHMMKLSKTWVHKVLKSFRLEAGA